MKTLKLIPAWLIVFVSSYYGLIEHVEGAFNLATFFITIYVIIGFFLLSDTAQEQIKKNTEGAVRSLGGAILTRSYIPLSCLYVWFGHWVVGSLLLLYVLCIEIVWNMVEKSTSKEKQS